MLAETDNQPVTRLGEVIAAIERSWRTQSLRMEVRGRDRLWRYWQRGPLRRLETEPQNEIQVARPDVGWRSSPDEGVVEYHNTYMSFGPPEGLEDLTGILSANLAIAGEAEIAGRHAVRLIATPRSGAPDYPSRWMFQQQPQIEFWVDAERGIGLRTARVEVTEIAFDQAIDERLFEAPPAPAGISTPIQIAQHEAKRLTTEQAIAESPLPLMTPTRLPAGTRLLTWLKWDFPKFKWIGAIYLVEPGPYCAIYLHLSDRGPAEPEKEWEELDVNGAKVSVSRDERNPAAPSWARIERNGVVVSLQSVLPTGVLAEIAASVEPL